MWISAPPGTGGISLEQQPYQPIVVDGVPLFEVPDHLSSRLLDLDGWKVGKKPAQLPKDYEPVVEGEESKEIKTLAASLSFEKQKSADLQATLETIAFERDNLKLQVAELTAQVHNLEDDLKEAVPKPPTVSLKK